MPCSQEERNLCPTRHCWGENYTLDAWANLNSIAATTNPNYTGCSQESGFSSTADANNHLPAWAYDLSGNATSDGFVTNYVWDAESQLKSAAGVSYTYDGDGRRVSKVGSKLYWYGSGGDILAETSASGAVTAEYIFFGGKRIAMIPFSGTPPVGGNPIYYVEDLLGTSRVITTNAGVVCYDADFYPYGGERSYTNTCPQNYKFEGKERDTETGNDDFGARYYSNRFGRWLSADWSSVPVPVPYANLTNPQTLNLYSMVADDPESFADLDGHIQQQSQGLSQEGCALAGGGSSANTCARTVTLTQITQTVNFYDKNGNVTSTVKVTTDIVTVSDSNTGAVLSVNASATATNVSGIKFSAPQLATIGSAVGAVQREGASMALGSNPAQLITAILAKESTLGIRAPGNPLQLSCSSGSCASGNRVHNIAGGLDVLQNVGKRSKYDPASTYSRYNGVPDPVQRATNVRNFMNIYNGMTQSSWRGLVGLPPGLE